jgi:hypothetical protein
MKHPTDLPVARVPWLGFVIPIHPADAQTATDGFELRTPHRDGCSNAREQVMGTDPAVQKNSPFSLNLPPWAENSGCLNWLSSPYLTYAVREGQT